MDQSTSKAAGTTKVVKPVVPKSDPKDEATASTPLVAPASAPTGGAFGGTGGGGGASASTHDSARRRDLAADAEPLAPLAPAPVIPEPVVVKEPSVDEIAAIQVGASAHDLEAALGAPESRVSIPDDDGHLVEICQYWAKGQPLGTVRLDNGRVISVQTRGY
jgi:hypothetical protein